jgi:hypothetical protein
VDIFDAIANSKASNKSDNFRDGKGIALIEQCIHENMNEGPTFVGRFKILHSESKGDLDPKTKQPVAPNAAGSRVGWPQKLAKFKSALGNVKAMILNTLGMKEAEVSPDDFKATYREATGAAQPFRGFIVTYETYQQAVRAGVNAGQVNTYVRFGHVGQDPKATPVGGNTKEEIAKRRADLDKEAPLDR